MANALKDTEAKPSRARQEDGDAQLDDRRQPLKVGEAPLRSKATWPTSDDAPTRSDETWTSVFREVLKQQETAETQRALV